MAEASKSSKDPVLEEKFLLFLKERIERYGVLSIKNLTGHLSALSPRIRNHFGASRNCLKQFLTDHPKDFYVDKKDNVKLVTRELHKNHDDQSSDHSTESSEEDCPISISPSSSRGPATDKTIDFPKELYEVRGKIYRMFPAFGFISVTSPVVCSVYFNLSCFENSKARGSKDGGHDISIGEGVFLHAKRGPENCEAHYRATKVWRVEGPSRKPTLSETSTRTSEKSSPVPSCSSKDSTPKASAKKEIFGKGKIENLFLKFGFISQSKGVKDNIFFHVKTVHIPRGEKKITNLLDVLKLGDTVSFSAIPTEQKNTLVRWQATRVWTDAEEILDGSDIYLSSPEGSVSSGYVYSLPLVNKREEVKKLLSTVERTPNGRMAESNSNSSGKLSDPVRRVVDASVNLGNSSVPGNSLSNPILTSQTGTVWPHSESIASILFGTNQKALALVDVFYQCEERIDNFMWELEDGQRIQFEAIEDLSWAAEYPWKVLLAWVGRKPDIPTLTSNELKGIYDNYAKVQGEPIQPAGLEGSENEEWREPENAPVENEDDDEDFVEENLEDDLVNDDNFSDDDENSNPSDLSANEVVDLEDDGFVENLALETIPVNLAIQNHMVNHTGLDVNLENVSNGHFALSTNQVFGHSINTNPLPLVSHIGNSESAARSSTSTLERRVDDLTLLVHELLRRVPPAVSRTDKCTQTEELLASPFTEAVTNLHPFQNVSQEVQTVSTGGLMYTELYFSQ